jgi:hypothetical protein
MNVSIIFYHMFLIWDLLFPINLTCRFLIVVQLFSVMLNYKKLLTCKAMISCQFLTCTYAEKLSWIGRYLLYFHLNLTKSLENHVLSLCDPKLHFHNHKSRMNMWAHNYVVKLICVASINPEIFNTWGVFVKWELR